MSAWLAPPEGGDIVSAAPAVAVRELFRRFWPLTRPYRRWLFLGFLLLALVPALETVQIWFFKIVVDQVLVPAELEPLLWIAAAYIVLALVSGAAEFADDYLAAWIGERFLLDLRTKVYSHLQSLSLDALDRRRLGDLLARLTGDVQQIESFVLSGVGDAVSSLFRILFFAGALFYLQWDLALISLVVVPLFWGTARRFTRLIKRASREKRRRSGALGAVAEEGLANAALVQAYNRQGSDLTRFRRESEGIMGAELAATRLRALFTPVVGMIELVGGLIVIGWGTWALSEGRLSLGGLLVFLAYLTQLYGPIRDLGGLANSLFAASAAAERVVELLDEEPRVRDRPGAIRLEHARGDVELDGVSFTYRGRELPALHGVSLRAEPGQTIALVGASGAGKSTLAKLLLRFYDPDGGAVRLDGHDLRELELDSLRENVAVLLQETLIFDGTVRENIAFGREGATDAEVEAAARAAGAHEFIEALPAGYDTPIGQKGRSLSGGQRQRVAIARALVRDAPVLILDEPSTGLDAEATERLLEPLRRLMAGRTTFVITHNLVTVRDADQIVVLEAGRVIERGSHEELLAGGGTYARLHGLQALGREPTALEAV